MLSRGAATTRSTAGTRPPTAGAPHTRMARPTRSPRTRRFTPSGIDGCRRVPGGLHSPRVVDVVAERSPRRRTGVWGTGADDPRGGQPGRVRMTRYAESVGVDDEHILRIMPTRPRRLGDGGA